MKTKLHLIAILLLAAALTAHAGPISKGGFVISKPGKYFLTKNISALLPQGYNGPIGVVIQTDDVELDLAGFSIGATNGIGVGIYLVDGVKQVRVRNGRIQGVQYAIVSALNKKITSCIFEGLQIVDCTNDVVRIEGSENVIRSCTVTNVAQQHHGIIVLTTVGKFNEVSDCTVSANLGGGTTGINSGLTDGLIVRRCVVAGVEEGIRVTDKCKLLDNLTIRCATGIVGNPVLVGSNN
jgi:hypothetical protein